MDAEYEYGTYMVLPCFVVVNKAVDLSTIIKLQILIKLFVKLEFFHETNPCQSSRQLERFHEIVA